MSEREAEAPCEKCGYNGPGYYQPETHRCAGPDVDGDEALDIATQAYMDAVNIGGRKGLERTVRAIREYGKRERERALNTRPETCGCVFVPEPGTVNVALAQARLREVATLQEKLRQAEAQHKAEIVKACQAEIEEHEAALCPEDFGCAEYIDSLIRRAEKAEAALGAERAQTRDLDSKLQGMEKLAENFRVTLAAEREAHQRTRELAGSECVDHGQRISDLEGALRALPARLVEKYITGRKHTESFVYGYECATRDLGREAEALLSRLPEPSGPVKPGAALGEGGVDG